jgi:ADP-heptose:LPS heptosyltransferase
MRAWWKALWGKIHWHANEFLIQRPGLLARTGMPLTVVDAFGTPGDTLLTATVCRELKKRHPRLKINCVTPNPSLLELDPNINSLNLQPTFCSIQFWYLDLIQGKDATTNVLKPTLDRLGIREYEYRSQVHLSPEELQSGERRLAGLRRPIISINTTSRERVKTWPLDYWRKTVDHLLGLGSVIQLGDSREPVIEGVVRFAGKLSMRDSMAVLAHADLHIGPDSFLMHAANGVRVPAIIIYGGSRPPQCLGYANNVNLFVRIECGPCWIHDSRGGECSYGVKCMDMIAPHMVMEAVELKLGACKA